MLQLQFVIVPLAAIAFFGVSLIFSLRFARTWATKKGTVQKGYTSLTYDDKDDFASFWLLWLFRILAIIMAVVTILIAIPFQSKYWAYTEHRGTIATVSNRFVDGSGDLSSGTYTLTLQGDRTPLVVSDTRLVGIKTGDSVDLTCTLAWVYNGADESDCFIRSFGK